MGASIAAVALGHRAQRLKIRAIHVISPIKKNMSFDKLSSGRDVPNDINVVIEIPMHGEPIKYEVDKASGAIFVDRFMSTAMHYPCNYGYIPRTLSGDGDPADVLVITPIPLMAGVVVRCRPIGMLKMQDEAGNDEKLLAVPVDKLTSIYRNVQSPRDLPPLEVDRITHFFEHYKDLEAGKFVKVLGWTEAADARNEILAAMKRFDESVATK
jgi:inorganic pyrophosphatase